MITLFYAKFSKACIMLYIVQLCFNPGDVHQTAVGTSERVIREVMGYETNFKVALKKCFPLIFILSYIYIQLH